MDLFLARDGNANLKTELGKWELEAWPQPSYIILIHVPPPRKCRVALYCHLLPTVRTLVFPFLCLPAAQSSCLLPHKRAEERATA